MEHEIVLRIVLAVCLITGFIFAFKEITDDAADFYYKLLMVPLAFMAGFGAAVLGVVIIAAISYAVLFILGVGL